VARKIGIYVSNAVGLDFFHDGIQVHLFGVAVVVVSGAGAFSGRHLYLIAVS
jgi:hypothetical protein